MDSSLLTYLLEGLKSKGNVLAALTVVGLAIRRLRKRKGNVLISDLNQIRSEQGV